MTKSKSVTFALIVHSPENISVEKVDGEETESSRVKFTTQAFLYEEPDLGAGNTRMLLLFDDEVEVENKGQNIKHSEMSSINWSQAGVSNFYVVIVAVVGIRFPYK